MFNWTDYASYTLEELLAAHSRNQADIASGNGCDNFAPGTCCNYCNRSKIVEELTKRLSVPVEVN